MSVYSDEGIQLENVCIYCMYKLDYIESTFVCFPSVQDHAYVSICIYKIIMIKIRTFESV